MTGLSVSLTEKEQQVLADIERRFHEEDDSRVSAPTLRSNNTVAFILTGLLVAGMLMVLIFFTSRLPVALAGVAIMVGAGVFLVNILRPHIRIHLESLDAGHRGKGGDAH